MIVTEHAPAKINIGLKITGKRNDGYHNILSIFQTVDLYDEVTIDTSHAPGMECTNTEIPVDSSNLVLKAEKLFSDRLGISSELFFQLTKHIPAGAGMAGGSSDAAATLRGLRTVYAPDMQNSELYELAGELGSDVPFLIHGGTAIVSGRGEVIKNVNWPFDFTYVLVYPNFAVSTSWAYGTVKTIAANLDPYIEMTEKLYDSEIGIDEFFLALENDFEKTVFKQYPKLGVIKRQLKEHGARSAFMTGSGSTVMGIFETREEAARCVNTIQLENCRVFFLKACSQ